MTRRKLGVFVAGTFLALVIVGAAAVVATDLDSLREQWWSLREQDSSVLAPKLHERSERSMEAVEAAVESGGAHLQKRVDTATKHMAELDEAVRRAYAVWAHPLRVREAAREVGADSSSQSWTKAENILVAAARKLETGRRDAAVRQASPLPGLYDQARLEALHYNMVGGTRASLTEAERGKASRYTPRSYVRALDAVRQTEQLLDSRNGEADAEVQDAAVRAARLTEHAHYLLSAIRSNCEEADQSRVESLILEWEAQLLRVMQTLGLHSDFENGMSVSLQQVQVEADQVLRERNHLRIELAQRSDQVDSLQYVISELRDHVRNFEDLVDQLKPFQEEANTVATILNMFTHSEGKVLQHNRDLVLSLHGLRFESGRAEIPPQSFPILDKVIRAVKALPGSHVVIEGHTDSQGRADINKQLSQERAQAVRAYLVDEAGIEAQRITAIGYGADRPVATNDTAGGRALNRRIEITISRAD
jgi:outer membrane protein OmpA-like peptidoglycan-associated protein